MPHFVKKFDINGVKTKQVACIELHGRPNAATKGAVGVLGMDVDSPTREVYKCVAVNGAIYTWQLLSGGESVAPTKIDLSALDTEGKIVETFADGSTKTTTMEFDEAGNPIKITDADGNVTELVWENVFYTVTYNAPNCTIDPMPETVDEGGRLELLAWSDEGYNLDTIQVTMGGVDISDQAVNQQGNDAQISIVSVTGDVVVTITTMGG